MLRMDLQVNLSNLGVSSECLFLAAAPHSCRGLLIRTLAKPGVGCISLTQVRGSPRCPRGGPQGAVGAAPAACCPAEGLPITYGR